MVLPGQGGACGDEVMDALNGRTFVLEGADVKYLGTGSFGEGLQPKRVNRG